MSVSLRKIDQNSFWECIKLKVAAGQEEFVASNVRSIAESKVYPYFVPLAVYDAETLVGFAMYGRDPASENYWIARFYGWRTVSGSGLRKSGAS